jgi:hypothetical protein
VPQFVVDLRGRADGVGNLLPQQIRARGSAPTLAYV